MYYGGDAYFIILTQKKYVEFLATNNIIRVEELELGSWTISITSNSIAECLSPRLLAGDGRAAS